MHRNLGGSRSLQGWIQNEEDHMVAYIVCRSSYSFLGGSLMKCVPRKLFNPASSEGKRRDVSSKPFREDTLFFSPPKKVLLKSNFESLFFISIALKKKKQVAFLTSFLLGVSTFLSWLDLFLLIW